MEPVLVSTAQVRTGVPACPVPIQEQYFAALLHQDIGGIDVRRPHPPRAEVLDPHPELMQGCLPSRPATRPGSPIRRFGEVKSLDSPGGTRPPGISQGTNGWETRLPKRTVDRPLLFESPRAGVSTLNHPPQQPAPSIGAHHHGADTEYTPPPEGPRKQLRHPFQPEGLWCHDLPFVLQEGPPRTAADHRLHLGTGDVGPGGRQGRNHGHGMSILAPGHPPLDTGPCSAPPPLCVTLPS